MSYRFFFSYASRDWDHARRLGSRQNDLDDFFELLSAWVGHFCGDSKDEVGFFAKKSLQGGDFWDETIQNELDRTNVLVALLSPAYVKSDWCGREFEFVRRRFEALRKRHPSEKSHILPLFRSDIHRCLDAIANRNEDVATFISRIHHDLGLGDKNNYPTKGLLSILRTARPNFKENFCEALADRIQKIECGLRMPSINWRENASALTPAFASTVPQEELIFATGPSGTNVIYAIATQHEMAALNDDRYASTRSGWKPFCETPNETIEDITRKALSAAGQKEYCNLDFPRDLIGAIREAEARNSPILIVLDPHSLRIGTIADQMRLYNPGNGDFAHLAVVDCSGSAQDAPISRTRYVCCVIDLIGAVVAKMRDFRISQKPIVRSGRPLPELSSALTTAL